MGQHLPSPRLSQTHLAEANGPSVLSTTVLLKFFVFFFAYESHEERSSINLKDLASSTSSTKRWQM